MRWTYLYLFTLFSLVVCVAGLPTRSIKTNRAGRARKHAIAQLKKQPFIRTKQIRDKRAREHAIAQKKMQMRNYNPSGDQAGIVQIMSCLIS